MFLPPASNQKMNQTDLPNTLLKFKRKIMDDEDEWPEKGTPVGGKELYPP